MSETTNNSEEKKLIQPANVFLLISFLFGIVYIFLTPPFQVPDEPYHFLRAWQISEGRMMPEVSNGTTGDYFPEGLAKVAASTNHLRWSPSKKITIREITALLEISVGQQRIFITQGSAGYSPVPYLPQTAAIILVKPFHFSPLSVMYWIRIVNLLTWAGIIYAAIRITPIYPNLFVLLALTPMSLYQATSASADAMTNGLALLTLSLVLHLSLRTGYVLSKKSILRLVLLMTLLSLCKNIYFLFILLVLFIPICRFGSIKRYIVILGITALTVFLVNASWSVVCVKFPLALKPGVNPSSQFAFITSWPGTYLAILYEELLKQLWLYRNFVGCFGWTDCLVSKWHARLWMLLLLAVALTESRRNFQLEWWKKIICGLIFATETILTYTLLYLFWNEVGSDTIVGMQGRYFIPIMPLFFLLFYNTRITVPSKYLTPAAGVCSIVSLICAAYVIGCRFYV